MGEQPPVEMTLADDDHACAFCGQISAKGIVAQVGDHQFFTCTACMTTTIKQMTIWQATRDQQLAGAEAGEERRCTSCGQVSKTGAAGSCYTQDYFMCEQCLQEVAPTMWYTWTDFGPADPARWRRKNRPRARPHQSPTAKERATSLENVRQRIKEVLKKKRAEMQKRQPQSEALQFCPNCAAILPRGAEFCPRCGSPPHL